MEYAKLSNGKLTKLVHFPSNREEVDCTARPQTYEPERSE